MVTASISLRDVGRTFGATRALAGVDLDLKPGVTGLLGPNGAGKTTLLRLLATALPPSQGQVRVLGLDPEVPAERTGIRRQLGYQPQEAGFPRGFTAFAFVDYIALLKEWTQPAARHAEVRRVLDLVGLSDLGAKRIRAMSGGQRRRVALAQALLGSPPVLILDEPTTGVDPEQRVVLRTVLAEIARTSVVVLSTHQTEDVAALCERVIVLDRGRVRYDGPVTDLTGQAAGRVWLADEPDPAASVSWRTGTGRYRNVGARVRDGVEHVEPSLEDAYLLLRGGSPEHRDRRGGGVMTATLTFGPPAAAAGRATFTALAARETRRFVLNPVFLFAVALTAWSTWAGAGAAVTEIDDVNAYPAIFLGGFGMMATYWLTRSMRASEPVVGVTPVTRPARTAALCAVAIVPFGCGCLALLGFLQLIPGQRARSTGRSARQRGSPSWSGRSSSRRSAARCSGSRWAAGCGSRAPRSCCSWSSPAGWSLVTILTMSHPDSAPVAVLRLFSPFAFFTLHRDAGGVTAWRGSPWFFIGWQLALCAIAVLVALLRGAEGRVRSRIIRALGDRGRGGRDPARAGRPSAGSPTPSPRDDRSGAAGRGVAGGRGRQRRGGRGGRLRGRVPGGRHRAAPDLLRAARRGRGVHPRRAGQPGRRRDADRARSGAPRSAPWRCWRRSPPARWCCWRRPCADRRCPGRRAGLALAGNVLLGFAVACVLRTRTGEPGPAAGTAVVLVLMAPTLVPHVARWVRTFPAPGAGGPSSDTVWWTVLAVCVVAIAVSVGGRSLPRWMSRVP